jgi:hypothetical protein
MPWYSWICHCLQCALISLPRQEKEVLIQRNVHLLPLEVPCRDSFPKTCTTNI